MAANTEVIIEMSARPWNQTLNQVAIGEFPVTSVALLRMPDRQQTLKSSLELPLVIRVSTVVRLVGHSKQSECPG